MYSHLIGIKNAAPQVATSQPSDTVAKLSEPVGAALGSEIAPPSLAWPMIDGPSSAPSAERVATDCNEVCQLYLRTDGAFECDGSRECFKLSAPSSERLATIEECAEEADDYASSVFMDKPDGWVYRESAAEEVAKSIRALKGSSAAPAATDWIEVGTSDVPVEGHSVIVYSSKDECQYTAYTRDGVWYHFCGGRVPILKVTHWMPLQPSPHVANGVCPCCTRSFQNLAQHMKNQHPGFPQAAE